MHAPCAGHATSAFNEYGYLIQLNGSRMWRALFVWSVILGTWRVNNRVSGIIRVVIDTIPTNNISTANIGIMDVMRLLLQNFEFKVKLPRISQTSLSVCGSRLKAFWRVTREARITEKILCYIKLLHQNCYEASWSREIARNVENYAANYFGVLSLFR